MKDLTDEELRAMVRLATEPRPSDAVVLMPQQTARELGINVDALIEADRMLHPFGKCECAGEGECAWCQQDALNERVRHAIEDGIACLACGRYKAPGVDYCDDCKEDELCELHEWRAVRMAARRGNKQHRGVAGGGG